MTDHADIVRNESAWLADYADYGARATEDQGGFVDGDADSHRANLIAALDALVADNRDWRRLVDDETARAEAAEARVAEVEKALIEARDWINDDEVAEPWPPMMERIAAALAPSTTRGDS